MHDMRNRLIAVSVASICLIIFRFIFLKGGPGLIIPGGHHVVIVLVIKNRQHLVHLWIEIQEITLISHRSQIRIDRICSYCLVIPEILSLILSPFAVKKTVTENIQSMKIIGKPIDVDIIMRTKNTLFF